MQVGDLVRAKAYDTDLIGIVLERKMCGRTPNVAIKWFLGNSSIVWETESCLEVISASR
jgi:hypothetical protein